MWEVDFWKISRLLPRPIAAEVLAHSPTPSIVKTSASSNGEAKNDAGRVAQVVFRKQQALKPVHARFDSLELLGQQVLLKQLLAQPQRHRHAKRFEAARRECQVGLEQALELQERLVVEGDVIDLGQADAGLVQAITQGVQREARVVLAAREAFLLGGGDDHTVAQQCGCAVMVVAGEAEDEHRPPPQNSV